MIAKSFKVSGHECFSTGWAGFDEFKPITLIIGRNNSGKSHLLDVAEILTKKRVNETGLFHAGSGDMDQELLERVFNRQTSGGALPRGEDHWAHHGERFVGKPVKWQSNRESRLNELVEFIDLSDRRGEDINRIRREYIGRSLDHVVTPFYGRVFRRVFAERDIRPESESTNADLSFNGDGATNVVRRIKNVAGQKEELVTKVLLGALREIWGDGDRIEAIEVFQHEDKNPNGGLLWEVCIRETSKGRVPLSRSGSGFKTVILVLLNLLIVPALASIPKDRFLFAFEELENNLHPSLLRRLLRFIANYVEQEKCFVLLTTHSSVTVDFFSSEPAAQIIQVTHDGVTGSTKTLETHFHRVQLLSDLGSRPSDLLQANGVLWLEGPSDRIYFNRFIDLFSKGKLKEGRDYQCAFYGGSVLAKTEFNAPEDADEELANLLRLNNNVAIVCDGDRTAADGEESELKARVRRTEAQVTSVPGSFFWATQSKEIENYIPGVVWDAVYGMKGIPNPDPFDKFPASVGDDCFVSVHCGRKSFDKCRFAADAAPYLTVDLMSGNGEFAAKIQDLVETIRKWNR